MLYKPSYLLFSAQIPYEEHSLQSHVAPTLRILPVEIIMARRKQLLQKLIEYFRYLHRVSAIVRHYLHPSSN